MYIRTYVRAYVRTYVHTYVLKYERTYVRTNVPTYVRTYISTYVSMYVRAYLCTYVRACIRTYVRTYVMAHANGYLKKWLSQNQKIFGRTDLRIGVSGAKFDAESDFEVRLAIAPQKPGQIDEKHSFRSNNFVEKKFWCRKMKRRESSETRFGKISGRTEPSLRGKRPFKVSKKIEIRQFF